MWVNNAVQSLFFVFRWGLGSLGLVLMLGLSPLSAQQAPPEAQRVTDAVAAALVGLRTPGVTLQPEAMESLRGLGLDEGSFSVFGTTVLEHTPIAGGGRAVSGVVFTDVLERRVWLVLVLDYQGSAETLSVRSAEAYWNSPFQPEVSLRLLPPGLLDRYLSSTRSHAELLEVIVFNALPPAPAQGQSVDLVLLVHDRLPIDANLTLLQDQREDGLTGTPLPARQVDVQGWRIIIAPLTQGYSGVLKVVFTPGSDKPIEAQTPSVIGVFRLGG